ncbi:hypothetical protein [Paenibacillus sp. FSL L8-0708]|uniref:hypothetical protein n=1 Tax=Paenibacillus sp. FSL L8-0708 TaxID=2975311 RepID=UPI0030F970B7
MIRNRGFLPNYQINDPRSQNNREKFPNCSNEASFGVPAISAPLYSEINAWGQLKQIAADQKRRSAILQKEESLICSLLLFGEKTDLAPHGTACFMIR